MTHDPSYQQLADLATTADGLQKIRFVTGVPHLSRCIRLGESVNWLPSLSHDETVELCARLDMAIAQVLRSYVDAVTREHFELLTGRSMESTYQEQGSSHACALAES